MKYYKTYTLGCKVNTYETQAVCKILEENGFSESIDNQCDLIVINTCAVTLTSEGKSRQKIRSLKKEYPNAVIFVMGCYSQLHPEQVKEIEGVDIVIGTDKRNEIMNLLERYFSQDQKQIIEVDKDNRNLNYECLDINSYNENTRAFLKIQDGCNNFCTYCVIPYTRGNSRSRDEKEIIDEAKKLVSNGYQEIVFTGIDMASYGKDLKEDVNFNKLIKDLLDAVPELKRLRISSLEASLINDEFITLLKTYPQIAHHLHIPLQSGCEKILEKMNRKYTKDDFKSRLIKIREAIPDIALACDVIVGFPGESEEDFMETYQFIIDCKFDYLHVFPYSPRPGTVASKMSNQIENKVKKERVTRLINLGEKLKEKYEEQFDNQVVDVIVESYNPKTKLYKGYSSNYLEVSLKSEKDIKGLFLKTIYHKN